MDEPHIEWTEDPVDTPQEAIEHIEGLVDWFETTAAAMEMLTQRDDLTDEQKLHAVAQALHSIGIACLNNAGVYHQHYVQLVLERRAKSASN